MAGKLNFRDSLTFRLNRALVEACERIRELDDAQIRTYGLSSSEFDCLVTLGAAGGPMRMCDLARCSLLTKSHTTQVMKQLEARDLVQRERSPESDREVLASLTSSGQTLFEHVYPLHYRHLECLYGRRLSSAEQEDLRRLLRKLADGP
jgi:MarR family transcriptional regulator, 2-MHQ and catechol-resistance regulon repressor